MRGSVRDDQEPSGLVLHTLTRAIEFLFCRVFFSFLFFDGDCGVLKDKSSSSRAFGCHWINLEKPQESSKMSAAAFLGVRTGTFNRQIVGLSWGVTLLVFLLYFIPFTSDHKAFSVPQTNIRSRHSSDYDTINAVSDGSTGKLR